jgi:hypothetical protein
MEPSVNAMLARGNFAQAQLDTEHPPNRLVALLPASTHEPLIAAAAR